jgi:hypothetical protein
MPTNTGRTLSLVIRTLPSTPRASPPDPIIGTSSDRVVKAYVEVA